MVPCTAHVAEQTGSIEKSKNKTYFQTFHINFSPNFAGKEFWLKVYTLPGFSSPLHTSPLYLVTKSELQCVEDIVDFGDQVLALVGMHLLILDVCVLLELASYQPLGLH